MDHEREAFAYPLTPTLSSGKNDFKRPAFALGRISFGGDDDDDDSDSDSVSAAEQVDMPDCDARSKILRPDCSNSRPVALASSGAENAGSGGGESGGGKGGNKQIHPRVHVEPVYPLSWQAKQTFLSIPTQVPPTSVVLHKTGPLTSVGSAPSSSAKSRTCKKDRTTRKQNHREVAGSVSSRCGNMR